MLQEPVNLHKVQYGSRCLALRKILSMQIGVEEYVLKKITKDLPLLPIPVALKRDHLSGLKLATRISELRHALICCWGLQQSPAFSVMAGGLDLEARAIHN